jgi:hypothetical protein
MHPMRTTLFAAAFAVLIVAAACGGPKKPNPDEPPPGAGSDTTVTDGSATAVDQGSAAGTGSATDLGAGSGAGAGSADAGAGSADAGAGSGSAVAADDGPDAFLALSKDEKMKIMKTQVLPAMSKAFKAFDKKEFGKFTCKTCHGKARVADGSYEMPNPDLHKLDFDKLAAGKDHPKTAEFMANTVVPEMAKILGLEPATEANPKGFGCLHCHTVKQ